VFLADRFKWSLEYVDALDYAEAYDLIDIVKSMDKGFADNQKKALKQAKIKRGR